MSEAPGLEGMALMGGPLPLFTIIGLSQFLVAMCIEAVHIIKRNDHLIKWLIIFRIEVIGHFLDVLIRVLFLVFDSKGLTPVFHRGGFIPFGKIAAAHTEIVFQ